MHYIGRWKMKISLSHRCHVTNSENRIVNWEIKLSGLTYSCFILYIWIVHMLRSIDKWRKVKLGWNKKWIYPKARDRLYINQLLENLSQIHVETYIEIEVFSTYRLFVIYSIKWQCSFLRRDFRVPKCTKYWKSFFFRLFWFMPAEA